MSIQTPPQIPFRPVWIIYAIQEHWIRFQQEPMSYVIPAFSGLVVTGMIILTVVLTN